MSPRGKLSGQEGWDYFPYEGAWLEQRRIRPGDAAADVEPVGADVPVAEASPAPEGLRGARGGRSAIDHVFNAVITAIMNGELHPGERLPTEAELGGRLKVGRNAVREAIKILEAYGVVAIRRPEGTFVCERYSQRMLDPMLYGLLLQENSWRELIRLRGVLEIGAMHLAVRGVTGGDLAELEAIAQRMAAALREQARPAEAVVDAVMEADRAFHARIVAITRSPMIVDVTEYITQFTIPSRRKTVEGVLHGGGAEPFLRKHEDIVAVLRDRAAADIERVVLSHYEYWESGAYGGED